MSSLLSTASAWEPNDNTILKKRTPTLTGNAGVRKTVKNRARDSGDADLYRNEYTPAEYSASTYSSSDTEKTLVAGSGNSRTPMTIAELQHHNAQKQTRVNDMLNHITSVNAQNAGNGLTDFVPLSRPSTTISKPDVSGENPLLPRSYGPSNASSASELRGASGNIYAPNESALGKYSNYREIHDPANLLRGTPTSGATPYYAKMGIGKNESSDRMMEKINYMVRLLEEQQLEKTNHITEEFLLYTLLGVFVIYVVDSFSRAGKYMR